MRLSLPRPALETALDRMEAAWEWWLGELRALVPAALWRRLVPTRPILVLEFGRDGVALGHSAGGSTLPRGRVAPDELDGPAPPQLAAALAGLRPDRVELRLPAAQALHQRLVLPLASPRRLASLLRFELDRQTPFTPEQVYLAARLVERDRAGNRMIAELMLVKRDVADRALGYARRWGLTPDRLGIQGNEGWALDFQAKPAPDRARVRRQRLSAALAVATAGLVLALWFVHAASRETYADALSAELTRSRIAAEAAKALQKEVDAREAAIAFLAQRRQAASAGRLLEELATTLPDDSWVTEFELTGKALRLHGLSTAAAALPGKLGQSALLDKVQFTAATVPAGTGAERFDLSAELRDGGGP